MNENKKMEIFTSYHLSHEFIENLILKEASNDQVLQILDAGCGNFWPYDLKSISYNLIGIDKDKEALKIRQTSNDWHEIIEGDLTSVILDEEKYDIIHCAFVLEHIKRADLVLKKFIKWIKPGGLIIIRVPDPDSAKGFITKVSPHWFHVFYFKYILGLKNAGKPGYAPYPTYFSPIISSLGIKKFCDDSSNEIKFIQEYGDDYEIENNFLKNLIQNIAKKIINILSLGNLKSKHSNLLFILRKDK